jgi:thioredoxin-related protein
VANSYNVTDYPTIYLIDKTGKIIYANSGFNEGFENKLEELIKNNL